MSRCGAHHGVGNRVSLLLDEGKLRNVSLPNSICKKMERAKIRQPFDYAALEEER